MWGSLSIGLAVRGRLAIKRCLAIRNRLPIGLCCRRLAIGLCFAIHPRSVGYGPWEIPLFHWGYLSPLALPPWHR